MLGFAHLCYYILSGENTLQRTEVTALCCLLHLKKMNGNKILSGTFFCIFQGTYDFSLFQSVNGMAHIDSTCPVFLHLVTVYIFTGFHSLSLFSKFYIHICERDWSVIFYYSNSLVTYQ